MLSYRCSKCGAELQTSNSNPLLSQIERLRAALIDMTERVEGSWERRDLAPDSDLEAVAAAKKLCANEQNGHGDG